MKCGMKRKVKAFADAVLALLGWAVIIGCFAPLACFVAMMKTVGEVVD